MKNYFLVLMCLVPFISVAQFVPQKFGKLTQEELDLKVYAKDSSASAVVLFDKGDFYYDFSTVYGDFRVNFSRHMRMKILKKDGVDYATVSISMYGNSDSKEVLDGFKAFTYNVVDGKVEKIKVDKNLVYKEQVNSRLRIHKFTFPNVKEGSIVEFEFKVSSGYDLNVNDWYFQRSIPVAWSGYDVSIPEYYSFNRQTKGYVNFVESKSTQESKSINFGGGNTILYTNYNDHFVMQDIPAFKKESYMDCEDNYLAMVTYELRSIQVPGAVYRNYNTSWEKISEDLLDYSSFGGEIKSRGFFRDDLAALTKNDTSKISITSKIFNHVKSKVKWNDVESYLCNDGIKKAYKEGVGNSAEINLLLVAMLKEANIDAYPVILSTRDHGLIDFGYPSSSKVNYVIAVAEIGDSKIMLDATRKYNQMGVLPFECLNGRGRVVEKNKYSWISLYPSKQAKCNVYTALEIENDGNAKGQMSIMYNHNYANIKRSTFFNLKDDEYTKNIQQKIGDCTIDSLNIKNLKEGFEDPLSFKFSYNIPNKASVAGNNIFINPFVWDRLTENMFKLKKRTYPINFGYPWQERHTIQVKAPAGYVPDELPKDLAIGTSDKGIVLIVSYTMSSEGAVLVSCVININKTLFLPEEYEEVKELFNKIVEKQAEMISFKKA